MLCRNDVENKFLICDSMTDSKFVDQKWLQHFISTSDSSSTIFLIWAMVVRCFSLEGPKWLWVRYFQTPVYNTVSTLRSLYVFKFDYFVYLFCDYVRHLCLTFIFGCFLELV